MAKGLRVAQMVMPVIVPVKDHDWSDVIQVDKFGNNPAVQTADDPEDIWDYGGVYTFLDSSAVLYVSSSSTTDAVDINVQGLDADWNIRTTSVTLNGTSQVAISGSWTRVFRAYNEGATGLTGTAYIAESDTLSGGVPATAAKVKAKIQAGDEQTLMAIYTVPNGYTGYLVRWYAVPANARSSYCIIKMQSRQEGGVFRTKRRAGVETGGGSYEELLNVAIPFTEKTDIKLVAHEVGANDFDISGGFDILLVGDSP